MTELPRDAFLQIGDAAERAGLTQRTLRYYEEKGLLQPPSRMDGGFRLYGADDLERLERIKELKELLGFSLAEIREMLEADDVKMQLRSEWRKEDTNAAEKARKIGMAREVTLQQLALLEQKMAKMTALRDDLAARVGRYDHFLQQYHDTEPTPAEEVVRG